MRGIWLENKKPTYRDNLENPISSGNDIIVKTGLAGVCSTDLELIAGYYPYSGILGHEFVGEVVEARGRPELAGQRVVGEINIHCGDCSQCRAGRVTHCENRKVLGIHDHNGAFAEFLTLPASNLHVVPSGITDRQAVFTEPLAAALEITTQLHVDPNDRVLVVGAGRLGLLVVQVLLLSGAQVDVVVRRPERVELIESWGASVIWPEEVSHRYYDIVADTTGNPDGFTIARKAVRPRGTLVIKSTYAGDLTLNMSSIVVDEISLVGSRCGPFEPALNLLANGVIDTESLISAFYPLDQGLDALDYAAKPGVLKVLLEISG
jgi:2-desacetyl-2-hydroxyethyl bacteriochlorophyllide A dehydrogenase